MIVIPFIGCDENSLILKTPLHLLQYCKYHILIESTLTFKPYIYTTLKENMLQNIRGMVVTHTLASESHID